MLILRISFANSTVRKDQENNRVDEIIDVEDRIRRKEKGKGEDEGGWKGGGKERKEGKRERMEGKSERRREGEKERKKEGKKKVRIKEERKEVN